MDGGAWWAAVNGVAQSWTRLKLDLAAAAAVRKIHCFPSTFLGSWVRHPL